MGVDTVMNKQIVLNNYVKGSLKESDLSLRTSTICMEIPDSCNGAILVKNLYLSVDPYLILRMGKLDIPQFDSILPGSPIVSYGVSKVLDSTHPSYEKGELIWGSQAGWEEYSLIQNPHNLFKIQDKDVPLSYYVGILGMPGMTAYAGFFEICSPKKGETCVRIGCIWICWSACWSVCKDDWVLCCWKCREQRQGYIVDLLKNKFGFDDAFNYKEENDYDTALKRHFPEGIDIYFDNVGGKMLEAVVNNMRDHGRIAVCGMVSQYSLKQPEGIHNLLKLIPKQIRMQGFVVVDYYHLYPKFLDMVMPHIKEGKMTYVEDVSEGLESAPSALLGVYAGRNVGKQLVVVARE
nr:pulegone reductase-like1 protein [Mentha longifolia]